MIDLSKLQFADGHYYDCFPIWENYLYENKHFVLWGIDNTENKVTHLLFECEYKIEDFTDMAMNGKLKIKDYIKTVKTLYLTT